MDADRIPDYKDFVIEQLADELAAMTARAVSALTDDGGDTPRRHSNSPSQRQQQRDPRLAQVRAVREALRSMLS